MSTSTEQAPESPAIFLGGTLKLQCIVCGSEVEATIVGDNPEDPDGGEYEVDCPTCTADQKQRVVLLVQVLTSPQIDALGEDGGDGEVGGAAAAPADAPA